MSEQEPTEQDDIAIISYLETKFKNLSQHNYDIDQRRIYLTGGISEKSCLRTIKLLNYLESIDHKPIHLIINTGGGDAEHGLALIDAIRMCTCEVIGTATGGVKSMGLPILASCDFRIATNNCMFMWHSISYGIHPSSIAEHDVELRQAKIISKLVNQVLANNTNKPFNFWTSHKYIDFDFKAEDALEFGLVDEIRGVVKKQ